ncbi:MAG: 50S ribosomal protein L21, partial [candidate division CPR2 bacterium GW2011_GWD1_39_7]
MSEETKTAEKKEVKKAGKSSRFAVIETGGKQYIVREGQRIEVELLADAKEGKDLTLDALLVGDDKTVKVGKPMVEKATVKVKVLGDIKGEKLIVFKYKAKKNQRKKTGHRQKYTEL